MNKYLKIKENFKQPTDKQMFKTPLYIKILSSIFKIFTPKANPDFDKKIKYVDAWLLEFEYSDWDYKYEIMREIGIDEAENVLFKAPYKKNYGFWIDEYLDYEYFINHFEHTSIIKEYFEEKWNELID